jgi:regulator of sirC expression with transglutaminase-like and TPR domain
MNLDETLPLLAADPAADLDLAELALAVAADEYPALPRRAALARLDDLAAELAPRLVGSLEGRVAELSAFLFEELHFLGNATDYYDARNSYLNDVLDRRLGIPLTLSLVAIAVGRRCGLEVEGVGLPGHFIARAVGPGDDILFDPYHGGQFLDRDSCSLLVATVTGRPYTVTEECLAAVSPGCFAMRMLTNLKAAYLRREDYARAARTARRLVQLVPCDPTQRRDLGVCLVHAGRPGAAIDHLELYLATEPPDDEPVAIYLSRARRELAAWN